MAHGNEVGQFLRHFGIPLTKTNQPSDFSLDSLDSFASMASDTEAWAPRDGHPCSSTRTTRNNQVGELSLQVKSLTHAQHASPIPASTQSGLLTSHNFPLSTSASDFNLLLNSSTIQQQVSVPIYSNLPSIQYRQHAAITSIATAPIPVLVLYTTYRISGSSTFTLPHPQHSCITTHDHAISSNCVYCSHPCLCLICLLNKPP